MTPPSALPRGWTWARVGEVGEVKLGRQRSPRHHDGDHMRPYLRVANVFEDRIDVSDVLRMNFTPDEFEVYKLVPGDILLNEGQSLELVGRPAMYQGEVPGSCFQNTLVRFRASDAVLPKYALIVFRWYMHSGRFQAIAKWTTNIAHLGAQRLAELQLPVPPLAEQCRIVAEVEKQLTRLDAALASVRMAQRKLEQLRLLVLDMAIAGQLIPAMAAEMPTVPLSKAESVGAPGARRQSPVEPDMTDPPFVPPGWHLRSLGSLISRLTSGSRDWSPYYGKGSGKFILAQNVRPGRLDLRDCQRVDPPLDDPSRIRSQVQKDDLLVTIVGHVGRVCVVPENLTDHYVCQSVALMRPVDLALSPYLNIYLNAPSGGQRQFRRYAYGAGRPHLSFEQLRGAPVVLPPMAQQVEIVSEVDRIATTVDHLEQTIQRVLARAGRIRQSILKRAVEGRLVPQDPNDEPAAELLRRVQSNGRAPVRRVLRKVVR